MAKDTVEVEVKEIPKSGGNGGGSGKMKIIAAVVAVIIIIAVLAMFLNQGDGNGDNGDNGDENLPPFADFTYTPEHPLAGQTVNFNGGDSVDPDGDELTYTWDFDDQYANSGNPNTASGIVVSHLFTQEGNYSVTLTVDDGKGGIDDKVYNISVVEEATPTVSILIIRNEDPIITTTNIVWEISIQQVIGMGSQMAFSDIRFNFYNGTNTNDVKRTGLLSDLGPTDIIPPYDNPDGIYFDDTDSSSNLTLGDVISIAGDGGVDLEIGDSFQLIYDPNQMEMCNAEPLPAG